MGPLQIGEESYQDEGILQLQPVKVWGNVSNLIFQLLNKNSSYKNKK